MDLSTTYLGMKLRTPLVPSASPLTEDLDHIRQMEDVGAAAVVLHSLFEEQIRQERDELLDHLEVGTHSYAEALSYFPEPTDFGATPDAYLENIRRAKAAVRIPIIASLNGTSLGTWTNYARQIEQAGADALELNIYWIPTNLSMTGAEVEKIYLDIIKVVKSELAIPVAVKVSPYFTNFANMAAQIEAAGADGLVLFNRFYQPDIDVETMEIRPNVLLSTPMAMRVPLRWIALLHSRLNLSLAATGGVHRAADASKMLLAGADVTMVCSALLRHGIQYLAHMEKDLVQWMEKHEYDSVAQLKGSLSQKKCPQPSVFERAQYVRALTMSGH